MKKYIVPKTTIVKLNMTSAFMTLSSMDANWNQGTNVQYVKGASSSGYNSWFEDWSE